MTSSVPEWINESFFEKVLRSSNGDKNLNVKKNIVSIFETDLMSMDLIYVNWKFS